MITLKFFASCADQMGQRQITVAFGPTPRKLLDANPDLSPLRGQPHVRVSVNHAWADWDTPLKDGDEVAFLPPVSGG